MYWNVRQFVFALGLLPLLAAAQPPPEVPPGANLSQLQVAQPIADVTAPVTVTAAFDPPVVHPGQKCFYRVEITATESSIIWPEHITAPEGLSFGVNTRGQILRGSMAVFEPLTVFSYEVTAPQAGNFTVPDFNVSVYGTNAVVPQATLRVTTSEIISDLPPPQRLLLRSSLTNVFAGQPFRVSVLLPARPNQPMQLLREIQLNGTGFIVDKFNVHQMAQSISLEGNPNPVLAYICEMNVTPAAAGHLTLSAQGFGVGGLNGLHGPIIIQGGGSVIIGGNSQRYDFLTSEPIEINVSPLPAADRPDSFTGTIGQFIIDPPHVSATRLHTGQPISLTVGIHGEGDLTRYVPPNVPRSKDWQIIAETSPDINFTLIPRTDDVQATPAIPFSYFDPVAGQYVDATIPPQPVTVEGEGLPLEVAVDNSSSNAPPRLSGFVSSPGWRAPSLQPPQLHVWLVVAQFIPMLALLGLLQWDRRRRFLEAHPEIVRRIRARKILRREKQNWRRAVARGDAPAFAQSAVRAMQTACAPHFPAQPDALVGADITSVLDQADRNSDAGETVRKFFTAVDTRFDAAHPAPPDLLALEPKAAAALAKLEEKL